MNSRENPREALQTLLNDALELADAISLDLIAIRISEALDMLNAQPGEMFEADA